VKPGAEKKAFDALSCKATKFCSKAETSLLFFAFAGFP
jgi:hypothetical protein